VKLTCSEQTTGQSRASTRRICGTNRGRTWPSAFCILHGIHPSSNAKAGIVSGGRWQAPTLSASSLSTRDTVAPAFLFYCPTFTNSTQPTHNTPRHAYCRSHPLKQPNKTRETLQNQTCLAERVRLHHVHIACAYQRPSLLLTTLSICRKDWRQDRWQGRRFQQDTKVALGKGRLAGTSLSLLSSCQPMTRQNRLPNSSPAVVSSVSSSRTRRTRCASPQRPPFTSPPSSNT
jgi:hypothetical protein